jgi:hypothetical protein
LLYRAFEGVQSAVAYMMFMSFALCSTFWCYIFISFASSDKVLPGLGKGLKKISRNQEDGLHREIEENFVSNSQVGKQLKCGDAISLVNQMMDLIHVC